MNYVCKQSFGELLGSSYSMLRYFFTFVRVFILIIVPGVVAWLITDEYRGFARIWRVVLYAIPLYPVSFYLSVALAQATATVMVSEVCVGNEPSARRSLRRALRRFFPFYGTMALASLFILAPLLTGFLMLRRISYVPLAGLVMAVLVTVFVLVYSRVCLLPVIVVLEGVSGIPAMKRSLQLTGYGDALRLFGLTLLAFPVFLAPPVLVYYDHRVRREDYDVAMLGEDLRR